MGMTADQEIKCGDSGTWTAALIDKTTGTSVESTLVSKAKVLIGDIEYTLADSMFEVVDAPDGDYLQFSLSGTQTAGFADGEGARVTVKVILTDGRESTIAEELWVFRTNPLTTWHG